MCRVEKGETDDIWGRYFGFIYEYIDWLWWYMINRNKYKTWLTKNMVGCAREMATCMVGCVDDQLWESHGHNAASIFPTYCTSMK